MLQEQQIQAAVAAITKVLSASASAASAARPLFSHADYTRAISLTESAATDASSLAGYLPLLLPSAAPAFVRSSVLLSLIKQAKALTVGLASQPQQQPPHAHNTGAAVQSFLAQPLVLQLLSLPLPRAGTAACQHALELQLRFARSLPVHPSCVLPIAAMVDRAAAHVSSSAPSSTTATRRCQHALALMLVEESTRRPKESFGTAEQINAAVTRVRTVMRAIPHAQPFTSQLILRNTARARCDRMGPLHCADLLFAL
jgi:hypothetical protein